MYFFGSKFAGNFFKKFWMYSKSILNWFRKKFVFLKVSSGGHAVE